MNLRHMIANAVVRRVVYVAVAALIALAGSFISGKANAQEVAPCLTTSVPLCTRPEAYQHALAHVTAMPASSCSSQPAIKPDPGSVIQASTQRWQIELHCKRTTDNFVYTNTFSLRWFYSECPAGTPWDPIAKTCGNTCSGRPAIGPLSYPGINGACKNGCAYAPELGVSNYRVTGVGTAGVRTFSNILSPTGASCVEGAPDPLATYDPTKQVCTAVGNLTQCIKPNGDMCATASTGKKLCWTPGETGPRSTDDGSLGGDRQVSPTTPTAPPNQVAPTLITTTTTTTNGTTHITSIFSGSGSTGNQGNVGTGGSNTGTGTGTGDGDGEEEEGDGDAGSGLGDFYEPSEKDAGTVMAGFYSQVMATPILTSVTGFMAVSGGGSCPVFSIAASEYWQAMSYDAHCSGQFLAFLQAMGWVVLAYACYRGVLLAVT